MPGPPPQPPPCSSEVIRQPAMDAPPPPPPPPPPLPPASHPSKVLFGKYEVGSLLGRGASAKVYHARHTISGQSFALKVFDKPAVVQSGQGSYLKREISAMRRLRHPHVVRLHEVLASRSKIYLVLELAKGGELFARLHSHGRLPEDLARPLFHQLLSAIAYCHVRGVFHRDIKPENLLLDEAGGLKVSDFGLAALADHMHVDRPRLFHSLCGTPAFVAPEILSRRGYDPAKADLWSCGVVLFVLVAGYLPFNDRDIKTLYRKIYRGDYRLPRWASPELCQLLARLLDTDPRSRITAHEITEEPWFRIGLDVDRFRAMTYPPPHLDVIERKIPKNDEEDEDRHLNAFDIISFSSGFDLSGLFDDPAAWPPPASTGKKERFISGYPSEAILELVEAVAAAEEEKLEVCRKKIGEKGGRARAAVEESGTRNLVLWVEVYRLNRQLAMVEVETGGREEDEVFWKKKLRPALRGSVSEPVSPICGSSEPGSKSDFLKDYSDDSDTEETGSTRSV